MTEEIKHFGYIAHVVGSDSNDYLEGVICGSYEELKTFILDRFAEYEITVLEEQNLLETSANYAYLKIELSCDWSPSNCIYNIAFAKAIVLGLTTRGIDKEKEAAWDREIDENYAKRSTESTIKDNIVNG